MDCLYQVFFDGFSFIPPAQREVKVLINLTSRTKYVFYPS